MTHASTGRSRSDRAEVGSKRCFEKVARGVALQSTVKSFAVATLPACLVFIGAFRAVDDALISAMFAGIVFVLGASLILSGQSRRVRP